MLRHLQRLTRSFVADGQRISYINIYARPLSSAPGAPLEFIVARESGYEGIACVDDVARAAMLALQVYEENRSTAALRLARDWLGFVSYMQMPDGRFANFIVDETGARNLRGPTSYPGGKWWSARAMRALAMAWRVTGDGAYLRPFLRGRLAPTRDMKVKGVQALALMELYECRPDPGLRQRICALCDAIVAGGPGYFRDRVARADVALWGYHQFEAVARAGRLFARLDYLAACDATVRNLVEPVRAGGFYHVYPVARDHQCAYDVSPLVLGLEQMYRVAFKPSYRDLALACAAWLDGANPAGHAVYDAGTGVCFDGITHGEISHNCGAESSVEAGFIALARRRLSRHGRRSRRQGGRVGALHPIAAISG